MIRSTSRWGASVVLALGLSCARQVPPPAPRPEPIGTPLPPGLALTVRVDLASLRAELGRDLARRVLLDAFSETRGGDAGSNTSAPLLDDALAQSDVLWLGFPSLTQPEPESVLLMRGHFASLTPSTGGAGWTPDASGTTRLELQDTVTGYARVYRPPGDELLAWASSSSLPAVERALHTRNREHVVLPPDRGALSLAASAEPLLDRYAARYPELTERFEGLQRLEAFAEPGGGAWRADLTLDFDTPEHAQAASAVAERVRQAVARRACAVGAVARALEISSFERNVRVRAELLGPELDAVRACVLGDGCCA